MFYSSYNNPMVNYVLKKCLHQQDAELGTESVSADADTMIAYMSTAIINASGDNASQAGKLTSTDETELKHHRHIDTELDLRELKTTISSGKESSKELLESQQNKSVHGQNLLLASKAELLPQGDAVKASLNHPAALSQAQTQSLLDQSHTADSKEASAQAALQSLSAHHNGTSTASSLLGNRQDTSLNNQPPLLLTKEQAGDQLADKVQMMAAKTLNRLIFASILQSWVACRSNCPFMMTTKRRFNFKLPINRLAI